MTSENKQIFILLGITASVAACLFYIISGYSNFILILWLISFCIASLGFLTKNTLGSLSAYFNKKDFLAAGLLLVIFAPLYLYKLYTIPWQINTDEVTIMQAAARLLQNPHTDILGTSYYFGFPSLVFVVFGKLATILGGIDLFHFRLVHALSGLTITLSSYLFFRSLTGKGKAFTMAVILGSSHALLAISRMAMRDNTGLLLEIISLGLASWGLKLNNKFLIFWGGVVAGLGFYTYFPARVTAFIYISALVIMLVFYCKKNIFLQIIKTTIIFLLGLTIAAAPILIATFKQNFDATHYQKQQFLFLPEGQALEMTWTGTINGKAAWKANIRQGLEMFNSTISDQGFIYPNTNHGFVDPLTGVLLWIGIIISIYKLFTRKKFADMLCLSGFLGLYLSFAFLITKAPNYTRLLVILPFVAYFAANAIWWIGEILNLSAKVDVIPTEGLAEWRDPSTRRLGRDGRRMNLPVILILVISVLAINLHTFSDFVKIGLKNGNDVGSTARFIESHKNLENHTWILVASPYYPYYSWGVESQWQTWAGFFAAKSQHVDILDPDLLLDIEFEDNTTLLTTKTVWEMYKESLISRFPEFKFREKNITPDGKLLGVEIGE